MITLRPALPADFSAFPAAERAAGTAWVAEDGEIIGLAATVAAEAQAYELTRLSVLPGHRGGPAAGLLLQAADNFARERGARTLRVWSDTRDADDHAFYEASSFVRTGPLRALSDGSIAYGYAKPVTGLVVQSLDAAAAESAVPRLADILVQCVADNASVSFMPPLDHVRASTFWRRMARDVALGQRVVLAAWWEGRLIGCVSLDLATPENQPHRAELQKMLVEPAGRRRGAARALLRAAEAAARRAGRHLLTLDTANDAAAALYRSMEWLPVGLITGYAYNPDGTLCDTLLFCKHLR